MTVLTGRGKAALTAWRSDPGVGQQESGAPDSPPLDPVHSVPSLCCAHAANHVALPVNDTVADGRDTAI